jgi:hypothetical protein
MVWPFFVFENLRLYVEDILNCRTRRSPQNLTHLGTFAKLPKATINFVMSVCLSILMEQSDYFPKICREISSLIKVLWK